MSSVAKSIVEPFSRERETASTMMEEGLMVGWENTLAFRLTLLLEEPGAGCARLARLRLLARKLSILIYDNIACRDRKSLGLLRSVVVLRHVLRMAGWWPCKNAGCCEEQPHCPGEYHLERVSSLVRIKDL